MIEPKLYQALTDLGNGARTRAHNRRKRTEGVVVTPRPRPTPTPHDPYYRSDEQIAAYRERAKSQFPDD